jgi:hypothetical protein
MLKELAKVEHPELLKAWISKSNLSCWLVWTFQPLISIVVQHSTTSTFRRNDVYFVGTYEARELQSPEFHGDNHSTHGHSLWSLGRCAHAREHLKRGFSTEVRTFGPVVFIQRLNKGL